MEAAGLTVADLAGESGISERTVYYLLKDERPSSETLLRLSQTLGVSADYLTDSLSSGLRCPACGHEMEKDDGKYLCFACGGSFDPAAEDVEHDFRSAEALWRDELRVKKQLTIPGGGSKSSRRKRERPKHVRPAPTTVF